LDEHIKSKAVGTTVGFNSLLRLESDLPSSYTIELSNEPIMAGLTAFKRNLELLSTSDLINYGLTQYKNRHIIPNKRIDITFFYSHIPNIVPYSDLINYIVLEGFENFSDTDYFEQLEHLSNNLGIIEATSPVSFFLDKGDGVKKYTIMEKSKWKVITNNGITDCKEQIRAILDAYNNK
jgi:hypothetical protein